MLNQQIEDELGGFAPPDPHAGFFTSYSDLAPSPHDVTAEEKCYLREQLAKPYDRRDFGVKLPAEIERRFRDRRQVNVRQAIGRERRAS